MEAARDPAFDREMLAHLPALRRHALKLCRDETRAEDLVQEAVAKALANHDRFAAGTNMGGWLQTILRNHFLSAARKLRREVEDAEGTYAAAVAIPGGQEAKIALDEVAALLRTMPKELRDCLLMVADGLQYEEVAEALGLPVGTVKSRVNRARAMLGDGLAAPESEADAKPAAATDAAIAEMFLEGRSVSEIAARAGTEAGVVMETVARLRLSERRLKQGGAHKRLAA